MPRLLGTQSLVPGHYSLLTYRGYMVLRRDTDMAKVARFDCPLLGEVQEPMPKVLQDNLIDIMTALDRDLKQRGLTPDDIGIGKRTK